MRENTVERRFKRWRLEAWEEAGSVPMGKFVGNCGHLELSLTFSCFKIVTLD